MIKELQNRGATVLSKENAEAVASFSVKLLKEKLANKAEVEERKPEEPQQLPNQEPVKQEIVHKEL